MSRTCVSFFARQVSRKVEKIHLFATIASSFSLTLYRVTPFVKPVSQCFETRSLRTGVYRNTLNKQPIWWKNNTQGHQIQYSKSFVLHGIFKWFGLHVSMTICEMAVRLIRKLYSRDLNISPVVKNRKVTSIRSPWIMLSRIIVFCFWIRSLSYTTSFPGLSCEDEGRDEKALVWAGQFCILIG
jgi:hypothetical protein